MTIHSLADNLFVSPQIAADELEDLKARGIKAIINNRPDGEEADQPTSGQLAAAAARHGIAFRHIPVVPGQIDDTQVAAFAEAVATMPTPILAYCRSGNRSVSLWALASADSSSADDLVSRAAAAGFDIGAMRPRLDLRRDARPTDRVSGRQPSRTT